MDERTRLARLCDTLWLNGFSLGQIVALVMAPQSEAGGFWDRKRELAALRKEVSLLIAEANGVRP